jgi:demethoxyubiquinone hydroxylase (CLK1/Coq7/Cat5 family)
MSEEAPKSAYELAMERLRRKDAEQGIEERAVSDEQKAQIAEVRRVYEAKVAEAEILYKSSLMTMHEPEARMKLDAEHRRDLQRLQDDRERKLAKIRG